MHMNLKPNKHKIISFNTTLLGFIIVGTPLGPSENCTTWGEVQNFLLERGDKPVKGGGG